MIRVLLADDEESIRSSLKKYFRIKNIDLETAENGKEALLMLKSMSFDAVISDLRMPQMDGIELLKRTREEGIDIPFIMISAHGEINDAVSALKEGASDFIVKPFNPEELVIKISTLYENMNLKRIINLEKKDFSLIGESEAMMRIKSLIIRTAPADSTVLITGESGTGKEVIAREIHKHSRVSGGPFVAINIGGVNESLLESELFGYEKGAFTGANTRKTGLFEVANGGTLFLDEIGDMPLSLQVKILRVLQERKIQRLGSTEEIEISARIIAATNKNLENLVKTGAFREDLYYRLNVIRINVPPLRERKDDISILAAYIISKLNKSMARKIKGLEDGALERLKGYSFPGNIREMENIIERAFIYTEGDYIKKEDIEIKEKKAEREEGKARTMKEIEREAIVLALKRNSGNRTRASEELGISRRSLINKIEEYSIKD